MPSSYADALYGQLPPVSTGSTSVGPAPAASPPPAAGAGASDAAGTGARGPKKSNQGIDRPALVLLVGMVAAAIVLTQVTVRGELEVAG